jgi:hypothetical protein
MVLPVMIVLLATGMKRYREVLAAMERPAAQ